MARKVCYRRCCPVPRELLSRLLEAGQTSGAIARRRRRRRGGWQVRLKEEVRAIEHSERTRGTKRKYDAEDSEQKHPYAHWSTLSSGTTAVAAARLQDGGAW